VQGTERPGTKHGVLRCGPLGGLANLTATPQDLANLRGCVVLHLCFQNRTVYKQSDYVYKQSNFGNSANAYLIVIV
jgi:hypothetical protein